MTNLSHRMSLKDERIRNAYVPVPKDTRTNPPCSIEAQDRLREAMLADAAAINASHAVAMRICQGHDSRKGIGETAKRIMGALDVLGGGVDRDQVAAHLGISVKSSNDTLGRLRNRGFVVSKLTNVNGRSKNLWYRADQCSNSTKPSRG